MYKQNLHTNLIVRLLIARLPCYQHCCYISADVTFGSHSPFGALALLPSHRQLRRATYHNGKWKIRVGIQFSLCSGLASTLLLLKSERNEIIIKPICDVTNYAYDKCIATEPVQFRNTNDKYQAENILIGTNNCDSWKTVAV